MTNMSMMMGAGGEMPSMDMGGSSGGNMSTGEMKIGMQEGAPATEGATIGMQKQSGPSMGDKSMSMMICPCPWVICLHRRIPNW